MYIERVEGYYKGTEQHTRKGWFLLLVQTKDDLRKIRGIVRKVALRQLGQFMMGFVRVGARSLSISGSYGCDGLPMTVHPDVYRYGVDIPDELYEAWNKGGGWNSSGSEAPKMREWAKSLIGYNPDRVTHIKDIRLQNNAGVIYPTCLSGKSTMTMTSAFAFADSDKATCKNCIKCFKKYYPWAAEPCKGGVNEVMEILSEELNKNDIGKDQA